jgi:branched-chain amino acid transport system permease protein
LFGPVLGAFLLTGLAESLTEILSLIGIDLPGAKQVFYGLCLLLVIVLMPEGVWPWVARKLGLEKRQ